jgi:peptide/nickel transport system substrate-binding protein
MDAGGTFNNFGVQLLRSLGYRVSMRTVAGNYFSGVYDSRNRAQIGFTGWSADYPAPSDFFTGLFKCASFHPNDPQTSTNVTEFCDPTIDREMKQALAEQTTDPQAAQQSWQAIDRQIADQAPWVPLFNPKNLDILSTRVGNYQFNPSTPSVMLDQLWVR